MNTVIEYVISNWIFLYSIMGLLIFTFFVSNTRPIYKLKLSEISAEHWVAIFITSIFWLPVFIGETVKNKWKKYGNRNNKI